MAEFEVTDRLGGGQTVSTEEVKPPATIEQKPEEVKAPLTIEQKLEAEAYRPIFEPTDPKTQISREGGNLEQVTNFEDALQIVDAIEYANERTVDENIQAAQKGTREEFLKKHKLSIKTGFPKKFIDENYQALWDTYGDDKPFDREKAEADPVYKNFIKENPYEFGFAYEDFSKESYPSQWWNYTKNQRELGKLGVEAASIGRNFFFDRHFEHEKIRYDEIKLRMGEISGGNYGDIDNWFEKSAGAVAEMSATLQDGLPLIAAGAAGGAFIGGTATYGVGAFPGAGIGAAIAVGVHTGIQEGFGFYPEIMDFEDADGNKIDPWIAKGASIVVGIANGLLESVGFKAMTKLSAPLKEVMQKWTRTGVKTMFKSKTKLAAISSFLTTIAKAAVEEGATEAGQEGVSVTAERIAKALWDRIPGEGFEKVQYFFSEELWDRMSEAFSKGSAGGMAVSGTVNTYSLHRDFQDVKRAQNVVKGLTQLGEGVLNSEAYKNSPEIVAFIAKKLGEGHKLEDIYIDPVKMENHIKAEGLEVDQAMNDLLDGNIEEYYQAKKQSRLMKIPAATYIEKIAASEKGKALNQEITIAPDEYSLNETREIFQQTMKRVQEEARMEELDSPFQEFLFKFKQMRRDSGATEKQASAEANLWGHFFTVLGKQKKFKGMTPQEIFETFNITIAKEDIEGIKQDIFILENLGQSNVPYPKTVSVPITPSNEKINIQDSVEIIGQAIENQNKAFTQTVNKQTQHKLNVKSKEVQKVLKKVEDPGKKKDLVDVLSNITQLFSEAVYISDEKAKGQSVHNFVGKTKLNGKGKLVKIQTKLEGLNLKIENIELADIKNDDGQNTIKTSDFMTQLKDSLGKIFYQKKRGSTRISDKGIEVSLFKDANLSTFLHETGHVWLEILKQVSKDPEISESLWQDLETLREWFGIAAPKEGESPSSWMEKIQEKHHEQFAEGFEQYLLEGRAPSKELRPVFRIFKGWMMAIYDAIFNEQPLTDEVRSVMDRLLATEEQITEAKETHDVPHLFDDLMSWLEKLNIKEQPMVDDLGKRIPTTAEKYKEAIVRATEKAETELAVKHLDKLKKQQARITKHVLERAKILAIEDLSEDVTYVLHAMLTTGKLPNGSPVATLKLNKDAILKIHGPEKFAKIKEMRPYLYSKEGGMAPDALAKYLRIKDGDTLLNLLINMVPLEERIQQLVKQKSELDLEKIVQTEEELMAEALEYVHNNERAKVLQLEYQILVNEFLPTVKGITKDFSKQFNWEGAKNKALQEVNSIAVGEIKPRIYFTQMRKAAKEAIKAFQNGDIQRAIELKARELENMAKYQQAVRVKNETDRVVTWLNKKFKSKTTMSRVQKAGDEYVELLMEIAEKYSFDKNFTRKQAKKVEGIRQHLEKLIEEGKPLPQMPKWLYDQVTTTNYKFISYDQLMGIHDSVKSILFSVSEVEDLQKRKQVTVFNRKKRRIIEEIKRHYSPDKPFKQLRYKASQNRGASETAQFLYAHIKATSIFKTLDGEKDLGPVWKQLYLPIKKAQDAQEATMQKYGEVFKKIFDEYSVEERQGWETDNKYIPEIDDTLNWTERFVVLLNMGNLDNRQALQQGYGWTDNQLRAVIDTLSEKDGRAAQKVWNLINMLWPDIEALQKRTTGFVPEKIEPMSVETKWGTLKGGYYPLVFAEHLEPNIKAANAQEALRDIYAEHFAKTATKQGHTQERILHNGKMVSLNISAFSNHFHNVVHDLTHREAIIEARKLLADKEITNAIENVVGKAGYDQLTGWLKAVALEKRGETVDVGAPMINRVRKNMTIANLAMKGSTAFVQFLGLGVTIKEIGFTWTWNGWQAFQSGPMETMKWVQNKSTFMKFRMDTFERDFRELFAATNLRDFKAPENRRQALMQAFSEKVLNKKIPGIGKNIGEVQNALFYPIALMDMVVSLPTWVGAYHKALAGEAGQNILANDEQAAIEYADLVVNTTQGSGRVSELAKVQRGSDLAKIFTMFYTYFNVLGNQYYSIFRKYRLTRNHFEFARGMFILTVAIPVVEAWLLDRMPDDEADKKEWIKWGVNKVATYPFQSLVYARDIVNFLDGYGYSMSPLSDFGKLSGELGRDTFEVFWGDKEFDSNFIKKAFIVSGYVGGIPSRQLWLTGDYMVRLINGEIDAEGFELFLNLIGYRAIVTGAKEED